MTHEQKRLLLLHTLDQLRMIRAIPVEQERPQRIAFFQPKKEPARI